MSSIFKRQDTAKLQAQVANLKGGSGFQKDEKEWKLTLDAQKNGSAVIRFLPARSDDELAFVRIVSHSFKKNNQWYIENCSSTHGDYDGCPACKYISENDLYEKAKANKNGPEDKLLSQIGRKQSFWANVLIVKDPGAPENEGKVFKYRFGKKIMDKITAAINGNPELDEPGIAVTCPFDGANFTLKAKKVGDWPNYDDSSFGVPAKIKNIDDEEVQKAIFEGMSDLRPITAESEFKPLADLTTRFNKVMGSSIGSAGSSASADLDSELSNFDNEMAKFDNQTSDVKSSGGVSSVPVGEDDGVPFDLDDSVSSGDDDLDKLLDM